MSASFLAAMSARATDHVYATTPPTFDALPIDAVMDALVASTRDDRLNSTRLDHVKALSRASGVCSAWLAAVDAKATTLCLVGMRPVSTLTPRHALWFSEMCTGLCSACGGDAEKFNCIHCSGSGCASNDVAIAICGTARLRAVYVDDDPSAAIGCSVSLTNSHISCGSTHLICRHSVANLGQIPSRFGRDALSDCSSDDDEGMPAMWSIAPNLSQSYKQPNLGRILYTNPSESTCVPITGWRPGGGGSRCAPEPPLTLIYVWCGVFMWPRPPPVNRAHEALNCHVSDYHL